MYFLLHKGQGQRIAACLRGRSSAFPPTAAMTESRGDDMRGKQSSKIRLKKRLLKRRQAMTKRWGKQRTRRPPKADGAHVCRPRSIFPAAHVAWENDWTFFRRSGGETLRGFLISRQRPLQMQWALLLCAGSFAVCGSRRKLPRALCAPPRGHGDAERERLCRRDRQPHTGELEQLRQNEQHGKRQHRLGKHKHV